MMKFYHDLYHVRIISDKKKFHLQPLPNLPTRTNSRTDVACNVPTPDSRTDVACNVPTPDSPPTTLVIYNYSTGHDIT